MEEAEYLLKVLTTPHGSSFQMLYYSVVIIVFLKFNSLIMKAVKMKITGFETQKVLRKGY